MKQFTNVNKSSVMVTRWSRVGREMVAMFSGVKSRMSTVRPRFTHGSILSRICLVSLFWLIVGGFSTSAWASTTVTFNATNSSFSGSAPYTISQDSIDFQLYIPNWYNNGNNGHFYVYTANNDAYVKWTPNDNFSIAVTGISFNGQNSSYRSWFTDYTGKSYLKSYSFANSSYNTPDDIGQNKSNYNKSFTTSNTKIFPGGAALGNKDYFNVYARNSSGGQEAANSNTNEYQINSVTITYTVTPPAPTLKNGSSVTRSQFVEGRSNNTVTLTDCFKPFNSGVSMSYVVKKKNGSGVYETINSGYTITSNVFKTTVVGEYQIFANSNATGAFNASSSSSALAVTIEEVRPVTISVGSQELYVGGTTSMTITEQLNTTEDVVFSFDEDFFDYNESTHVLTAKNDANASFSTIEKSIRVTQESDGEFAAVDMTINFTIKKNVPTFTWNTREHYYYNETISHFFKSSNTATAISVTSTDAHKQIATIVDSALVVYNKPGTARVTMTQAENYYWAEHTEYRDITPEKVSNHVEFTYNEAMFNNNTITTEKVATHGADWDGDNVRLGGSNVNATVNSNCYDWDDKYIVIHFEGIPDSLTFEFKTTTSSASNAITKLGQADWYVQESATSSFGEAKKWTSTRNSADGYEKAKIGGLNSSTRYLKLCYSGNFAGRFKNIRVTELQYFRRQGENSTLDFATNVKDHVPAVQSFVVEHANAGYQTSVTAPEHYLVSTDNVNFASEVVYSTNATALTGGDIKNEFTVYVKYLADAVGSHLGNVTVHNNLRDDFNVPVTGTTKDKIATEIQYCGASSYSVDAANIASTTLFRVRDIDNDTIVNVSGVGISLSCEENDQFRIVENALDPKCGGTNNVKPSFAGNDTYAAATNNNANFAITITRLADEISFGDSKIVLIAGNEEELSSWNITSSSQAEGATLSFSTSNSGVLRVEDGKIIAVSKGEAKLYATSENTCTYAAGVDSLTIKVRNTNDPCETPSYLNMSKTQIMEGKSLVATITEGMHQTLTVSLRAQLLAASDNVSTIELLNKDNGVLFTHTFKRDSMSMTPKTYSYNLSGIANIQTAKTIRITGNGTTYYQEYDLIKITQQRYLNHTGAKNIAMTSVKACEEATHDIAINYSDVSTIQLNHQNSDFSYTVVNGNNGEFNNDCGDFGTFTLRATVHPLTKGLYKDSIFLSASGLQDTIVLSLEADKADRSIAWNIPNGNNITATQTIQLTAKAYTACDALDGGIYYTYESTTPDAATIDGDYITFHKQATVTVTAHTSPSDYYYDAVIEPYKTWTVGKVGTQMRRLPTITSTITYGDTKSVVTYDNDSWCAEDVLSHDSVPGTIAYVGPDNFTAAGPTNLSFNFTPSDLSVYDAQPFTVQVTVQKMAALNVDVPYTFCAGESVTYRGTEYSVAGTYPVNAEGDNRDTVYNVIVTVRQPSVGAESKTITAGDNESWNGIDLSGYAVGSHSVVAVLTNAVGCDSTVTLTLTVEAPVNEFTNAKGNGDWEDPDNWTSVPTGDTPDVIVSGELVINDTISVGSLTIEPTGGVTVIEKGLLTVNGVTPVQNGGYGDIHVLNDGALALGESANLKVRNFTLDAKLGGLNTESEVKEHAASGQVDGANQLSVNGAVYFQISLDPLGYITYGWYDFTVPFEVNINGGIQRVNSSSDKVMVSGSDFIIMEADEVNRANGGNGWRKLNSGVLQPGKLYTISLDDEVNQNTLRFTWNGNGTLENGASYATQCEAGSVETLRGWNGLGNGMLNHGHLTTNYKKQVYNHGAKTYEVIYDERTFAVGTAFFIQVPEAGSVLWEAGNATEDRPLSAPKREAVAVEEFYLTLSEETGKTADRLWVSASEEATGEYTIGHDLLKMGTPTSAKVAQMWTTRDNMKLCDIEMSLTSNKANTNLSLYAPKAGVYELAIQRAPADATLYLTQNNRVIWNLSMSPYDLDLTKGTTEGYGLRIVAQTPQVTTDVEQSEFSDQPSVRKVLIDNVLYIVTPEGKMYDILGKGMKF